MYRSPKGKRESYPYLIRQTYEGDVCMDTNVKIPIIKGKGPNLKDLLDSLGRRPLYTMEHGAHLVQCVTFQIGMWSSVHVLIEDLTRPDLEDQPWKFRGRIIQIGEERLSFWEPCHGEWAVTKREGWIVKEGK